MAENYFVFGDEELLIMDKVRELCAKYGSDTWAEEKLDSWSDFQDKMFTQAMFSEQRVFIMNYGILELAKPNVESIKEILSSHGNVLILFGKTKPDKRTQLFKLISQEANLVELSAPKGPELQRWVLNRARALGAKEMSTQAAAELIYLAGPNMLGLENELMKLVNYNPVVTVDSVRSLATRDIQISIFDFVDSVLQGNSAKALVIVEELFRGGAAEPYILHMLARQYRLIFRLLFYRQKGYGDPEILKIMPMHPYAFQKLCQQGASIDAKFCSDGLAKIIDADYAYKTGQNQGLALLQTLTVKLAKK